MCGTLDRGGITYKTLLFKHKIIFNETTLTEKAFFFQQQQKKSFTSIKIRVTQYTYTRF